MIAGRFPSIPSRYRDPASGLGHFEGHRNSLPEHIEIVWQLAELKDCKNETRIRSDSEIARKELHGRQYGTTEFVDKSDCTWHPLPDKVYRQQLDMQAIRNSEAYRKTGRRADGVAGSRYTLNLTLVFIEDRLIVEVDNGATNPWL